MITLILQLCAAIIAHFRRTPELPAFTVNLDDTEARWNAEAKEEWDLAFRGAVGSLPSFSRLEAERLKGASPAVAESERIRQMLRQPPGTPIRVTDKAMRDIIIRDCRTAPMEALGHLMAAPNQFVPNRDDLARYNALLADKVHGD